MTDWQPIGTAPKDGTLIVGLSRNAADVGWMYPFVIRYDRGWWQYNNGAEWKNWPRPEPGYWLPLPAPPTNPQPSEE